MDRPGSTYSPTTAPSSRAPSGSAGTGRTRGYSDVETDVIGDYDDVHDYDDYDYYDDEPGVYRYEDPIDRRWIWVAGVAGAILLIAVICTVVILGGGDSGSVSKTITPPPAPTTPAATSEPPVVDSPPAPPAPSVALSPETVTTVAPTPTASAAPAPAVAAPTGRTITYQVTGTRQLFDLVTVIYTDRQGALLTDVNVALPWSRTVTLDPGVELSSVTATSLTGQLNCSITDGSGATIIAQANNSLIATCTK